MWSGEEIENEEVKMVMKNESDCGVDRVSALPDSLLSRILSFVSKPVGFPIVWNDRGCEEAPDVKKIAATSVLSERWRYVWAELRVLSFQEESMDMEMISKFVAMVTRALFIRNAKYLEKFYLQFRFSKIWAVFVDGWLVFASKSEAKLVSLLLLPLENEVEYTLPEMFYGNQSLTELELAHCRVAPQRRVEWRCLTRLEFFWLELGEHVIENILSGCPVLYSLGLDECWGFNCLNINSPSVGKLGVWDLSVKELVLEISAPYLHYLEISFEYRARNQEIRVRNIPCVVKASIDICTPYGFMVATPEDRSYAKEWIEATLHIPDLCLTEHLITLVSQTVADGWRIPQSKQRVSLNLDAGDASEEDTIVAMISLLESSTQLEKLEVIIELGYADPLKKLRNDDFSSCDYLHLKRVEIECSSGLRDDDPIDVDIILLSAQILLRRAAALEKMLILCHDIGHRPEFMKIVEEVNSYPRSSKHAQLLILPH